MAFASQALKDLYGDTLDGLVKGGIRLSYSKNPLGVRTPTSGGNGSSASLQQQQQNSHHILNGTNHSIFSDRFSQEISRPRRDTTGASSPTSSYHYAASPPPRFVSSTNTSLSQFSSVSSLSGTSAAFPRANGSQGYGFSSGILSSFSPFGISSSHSTIPDQPSADPATNITTASTVNDHLSHVIASSPPPVQSS